jgi:hypothetical protein
MLRPKTRGFHEALVGPDQTPVGPDQRSDGGLGKAQGHPARCGACVLFDLLSWTVMVIAIAIAGLVEVVRGKVGLQLKGFLGDIGAKAVDAMLAGASKLQQGIVATS